VRTRILVGLIFPLRFWAVRGFFVLVSLALGHWVSDYWYLFTAFVGLNLFKSGFTNWCPIMTFFRKLGVRGEEQLKYA